VTRVFVTNDDGIDAEGLRRLAVAAYTAGLQVVVAAPRIEYSGSSAAIIASRRDGRVPVDERQLAGLDGVPAYAVSAPPALITLIAVRGGFGPPPKVVLSGINRGANTGRVVLHSGTVGAALTAAAHGCPALAVSLDVGAGAEGPAHWDTAARLAVGLLPTVLAAAAAVVFNINVPDAPPSGVRGLRRASLASFGAVQTNIEVGTGYVRLALADTDSVQQPGTDAAWLAAGYATLTPLGPICEASGVVLPELSGRPTPHGTGS